MATNVGDPSRQVKDYCGTLSSHANVCRNIVWLLMEMIFVIFMIQNSMLKHLRSNVNVCSVCLCDSISEYQKMLVKCHTRETVPMYHQCSPSKCTVNNARKMSLPAHCQLVVSLPVLKHHLDRFNPMVSLSVVGIIRHEDQLNILMCLSRTI